MQVKRVELFACLLLAAACGAESTSPDRLTQRDSAGIRVVTMGALPWEAADRAQLSERPLVQIGVEEGDSAYELYGVSGARRLSTGGIAISNSGTNEIRIYDARGHFVRAIGRAGKGPGEFVALGGVEVLGGDTLLAVDLGRSAIMAFSIDGSPLWSRTFDVSPSHWMAEAGAVRTRLDDGSFVIVCDMDDIWARIRAGTAQIGRTDRTRAVALHFTGSLGPPDTIAFAPGTELAVIEGSSGRPGTMYPAWGRGLACAVGPADVVLGGQENFEIRRYSAGGDLKTVTRGPAVDLTITAADLEELRSAMIAQTQGSQADASRFADEYLSSYPRPDQRPAYGRILLDSMGRIWISEPYHALEIPRRWGIVSEAVGRMTSLIVPARFEILDLGSDYVLGRWRDDADVAYVQLFGYSAGSSE